MRRPARGRITARAPRPRAVVGQPRRSEPMVRPTPRTILRQSIINGKIGALILLVAGLGVMGYIFRSPAFVVGEIEVVGVRSLDPATVAELAGVRGQSIWDIDREVVAARVVQNTYVNTATVQVLLPAQVIVRVQEREAAIVWNTAGNNYEIAGDGEILGPARTLDPQSLVIYDTRTVPITTGAYIDVDALDLAQTLNLRLPREMGLAPTRYEWDPYYGLSVYDGARQIAFGRMADPAVSLEVKLSTLKTLLDEGTTWTFLDLRPAKPYYRPVVAPTPTPEP